MGLFGFGKKREVLDLTERYKKQQEKIAQIQSENQETGSQSSSTSAFSFLGDLASSVKQNSGIQSNDYIDVSQNTEDKKRKLAKRLMDMTTKMEDLSNQIYHLQQRIEVLEKKSSVRY